MSAASADAPDAKPEAPDELGLQQLWRLVLKHLRLVGVIVAIGMLACVVYLIRSPKIYEADVTVKVPDSRGSGVLQQLQLLSSSGDPIETYLEIARSYTVASRAATMVHLLQKPEYKAFADEESAVLALMSHVSVSTVRLSNVLVINVRAQDPVLAAELADALAQGFIDTNLDFSRSVARSKRMFLEQQLGQVKARLGLGEDALVNLTEKDKFLGSVREGGGRSESDPVIDLQNKVMNLQIQRDTLARRYKKGYPLLEDADASLAAARRQLDKEVASVPKNQMKFQRRFRDVKVDESVYNLLLTQLEAARIAENVDDSGIVVVDKARVPRLPVAPRKARVLFVGLVASLALGVLAALLGEMVKGQVGSEDEVKAITGLPVLGLLPNWRLETSFAGKEVRHDPGCLVSEPRFSHTFYVESFKALRTNLAFTNLGHGLKTLSVLSANREEGKTLVNANLALTLALAGKRVCLVDADLRKPSLHMVFGLRSRAPRGLPLLLSGQGSLDAMLVPGPVPRLTLLPCGILAPNPSELMGSARLAALVARLRARFDFVVFDAAPVLPVTDSVLLASRLDGVLLLARYERTRRVELRRAAEQLRGVQANLLGSVFNAVDIKKYSYTYGYGRSYYNYGGSARPGKNG